MLVLNLTMLTTTETKLDKKKNKTTKDSNDVNENTKSKSKLKKKINLSKKSTLIRKDLTFFQYPKLSSESFIQTGSSRRLAFYALPGLRPPKTYPASQSAGESR